MLTCVFVWVEIDPSILAVTTDNLVDNTNYYYGLILSLLVMEALAFRDIVKFLL